MAREMDMNAPLVSPREGTSSHSAEVDASCLGKVTFSWLSPVITEGHRREAQRRTERADLLELRGVPQGPQALTEDDLLELRPDDRPASLGFIAEAAWDNEVERHGDQASMRRALFAAFGFTFFIGGCFKFAYDSLQMVGPFVLRELLGYLKECGEGTCEVQTGLLWVALIFVSNLVQTIVLHQYFQRCFRTGMRFNAGATFLIYKKSLKISGPGKLNGEDKFTKGNGRQDSGQQQRTTGEIVNLMSVDAQRLQDTMTYLHTLWSGPYQIIITITFLINVVGWATFAGLTIMTLQIPMVSFISRRIKLQQRVLMKQKDERVKITNEVFGAIRLLKMYGWEESFEKRVTDVRDQELRLLRKYQLLNIISQATSTVTPIITGVSTFAVYTALGHELDARTAFSAMSLFNVLRFPLSMLPNMVTTWAEAGVAFQRIESFLASPEIEGRIQATGDQLMPQPPSAAPTGWIDAAGKAPPSAIRLTKASFRWPGGVPLLADVSFLVPAAVASQERAHLTVALGSVGAGKSGLLQALIGDLSPSSGDVSVAGRIAYSSQVAWIRNATVKNNIIFNSPFDEERYKEVVQACQLLPDFDALPSGENTEIGEKGVNLSGGQKQRVSLARAVYANADLLLLDDPLSAVDSEVAKKLMKMLRGHLVKSSSIVLCTHYLGALEHADQVILLEREADPSSTRSADAGEQASQASTTISTARIESRVAFVGSLDEFRAQYPGMASEGDAEALSRQTTPEATTSTESSNSVKKEADSGTLVRKEREEEGSVKWPVYKTYIDAAGGMPMAVAVVVGLLLGQACNTGADSWISFWSDHSGGANGIYISSTVGLIGYALSSGFAFCGVVGTSSMFRITALRAAKSFHEKLLANLLNLPMAFFDTTPLGRVLNRFSADVYTIDERLVSILMGYCQTLCRVMATIVVITFATPWFLIIIIPLLLVYRYIQNYYVPSSRQIQRIQSNLKSPIFSHFAETLDGVACIRAFGQQQNFQDEIVHRIQRNMRAVYNNFSSNRWLAVRLEAIGAFIVLASGLLAVLARRTISAGVAGLSVSYAISVTQSLNWVVRMTSDRETNIVSVERLAEYIREAREPPRHSDSDPAPNAWPTGGKIEFKSVQMRYRPGLPLVLDGFDLLVQPGEKMGICGRTGAGKSSLLNVLLRIVDAEAGQTLIDGVDISGLGLCRLRRSITVLPQDPVMFSGTLRFNLDPLDESEDQKIWQSLVRSHLASHAQALGQHHTSTSTDSQSGGAPNISVCLSAVVAEKGENFSLGQRQQICLARALLRSNQILLLDEATSAVDVETDSLIQETIRSEFARNTVLCIAHRISTIMSSDRVCVLDSGRVAELGAPDELLQKQGSRFKRLAENDRSR